MNLKAQLISPQAARWLQTTHTPRIHSCFDQVCNLVNHTQDLLAIVTPAIGAGPFSLVLSTERSFTRHISPDAVPRIQTSTVQLGTLTINLTPAVLWSPRPMWEQLTAAPIQKYHSLLLNILAPYPHLTIQLESFPHISAAAHYLAGRGPGLTPSGDDFLLGLLFALHALRPPAEAHSLATHIVSLAAPRTTTLSAAWLQAAQGGAAQLSWHNLVDALISSNPAAIQTAANQILQFGHTSGADALSGFLTAAEALLANHPAAPFWQKQLTHKNSRLQ